MMEKAQQREHKVSGKITSAVKKQINVDAQLVSPLLIQPETQPLGWKNNIQGGASSVKPL